MQLIHISRNGNSLGIFKEEEVMKGIKSKRFSPDDLAWKEGMDKWFPISEIADDWGLGNVPKVTTGEMSSDSQMLIEPAEPACKRRSEMGFFKALFQTIIGVLLHPLKTFSKIEGKIAKPFFYYFFMTGVTFALTLLYPLFHNRALLEIEGGNTSHVFIFIGFLLLLLKNVLLFTLGAFAFPTLVHLSLNIIKAAHQPWRRTFSAFCYSFGSASIFQVIPVVGSLITLLWGSAAYVLGLKKIHGLSPWRTFFAILLTLLITAITSFCLMFLFFMTADFFRYYLGIEK